MSSYDIGNLLLPVIKDEETGCQSLDRASFEACRQSYYLKKQTELAEKELNNKSINRSTQIQCDYSEYITEVDLLKKEKTELQEENNRLKNKHQYLLEMSNNKGSCPPSVNELFLQNIFSHSGLVVLLLITIIILSYCLLKNKKIKKFILNNIWRSKKNKIKD